MFHFITSARKYKLKKCCFYNLLLKIGYHPWTRKPSINSGSNFSDKRFWWQLKIATLKVTGSRVSDALHVVKSANVISVFHIISCLYLWIRNKMTNLETRNTNIDSYFSTFWICLSNLKVSEKQLNILYDKIKLFTRIKYEKV